MRVGRCFCVFEIISVDKCGGGYVPLRNLFF